MLAFGKTNELVYNKDRGGTVLTAQTVVRSFVGSLVGRNRTLFFVE